MRNLYNVKKDDSAFIFNKRQKNVSVILAFLISMFTWSQDNDAFEFADDVTNLIGSCSTDAAYTTIGATPDLMSASCWANAMPVSNRWFKFTAPSNGNISVKVDVGNGKGNQTTTQLALWEISGNDEVACSIYTGANDDTGNDAYLEAIGLTPGDTYYISVDVLAMANQGSFTLCLGDPSPNIACQDADIYLDDNGTAIVNYMDIDAGSTDEGNIVSRVVVPNTFTCDNLGVQTVDYIITDDTGLTSQCQVNVNVIDSIAPDASILINLSLNLNETGEVQLSPMDFDIGLVDNCSDVTAHFLNENFSGTIDTSAPQDDFGLGNGNYYYHELTFQVEQAGIYTFDFRSDLPPLPSGVGLPQGMFVFNQQPQPNTGLPWNRPGYINHTFFNPNGDVSSGPSSYSLAANTTYYLIIFANFPETELPNYQLGTYNDIPLSFDCNDIGIVSIDFIAFDSSGNSISETANVSIIDNTPPTSTLNTITLNLDETGNAALNTLDIDDQLMDNCSSGNTSYFLNNHFQGSIGPGSPQDAFDSFGSYFYDELTFQVPVDGVYTFDFGTASNTNFVGIILFDDIPIHNNDENVSERDGFVESFTFFPGSPPQITSLTANTIYYIDIFNLFPNSLLPNYELMIYHDNPLPFDCSYVGDLLPFDALYLAFDDSNNSSINLISVFVEDNLAPDQICPSDETVSPNSGNNYILPNYYSFAPTPPGDVMASDNCGNLILSQDPVAGTLLGEGVHTITLIAEDTSGNVSNCTFELTVDTTLGNNELSLENLKIYPNPTNSSIYIDNPSNIELRNHVIQIFDLHGRLIKSIKYDNYTDSGIDLSDISSGNYVLNIKGDKYSYSQLVIKK